MKTENLKKWEEELNICIRCGYCYENCHLFKLTNWETDTPRGKLILLYGLLNGEIEPSEYVAKKIFECFFCKRCETSCSAKVSVTEILTDARADLIEAGLEQEGTTSKTDDDLCALCGVCVSVCKPEARSIDMEKKKEDRKVVIDKTKCEGCGVCVAACPANAISINKGFKVNKEELLESVLAYLGEGK